MVSSSVFCRGNTAGEASYSGSTWPQMTLDSLTGAQLEMCTQRGIGVQSFSIILVHLRNSLNTYVQMLNIFMEHQTPLHAFKRLRVRFTGLESFFLIPVLNWCSCLNSCITTLRRKKHWWCLLLSKPVQWWPVIACLGKYLAAHCAGKAKKIQHLWL